MRLFHGSNIAVTNPKILKSNRALDFGTGFYLTSDFEQAAKWAKLTVLRRGNGTAVVTAYELADNTDHLNIVKFDRANSAWLKHIAANRTGKEASCDADIIIGPVANDNTMPIINLYLSGSYSEDEAIKRLLTQKLKDQYTIKTEKALQLLTTIEVITL